MLSRKDMLAIVMREKFARDPMSRRPEPTANAHAELLTEMFSGQRAVAHAIEPAFHFNALATSRMTPENGIILHLGANSVAYLNYLAQRRPDIYVIGLEPDEAVVRVGQEILDKNGVGDRVKLYVGDMTQFSRQTPDEVALISSVYSLYQLPTQELVHSSLNEMALVCLRNGCALWIYDYARPRLLRTAEEYPGLSMIGTSTSLRLQVRNALMAAYSYSEMSELIKKFSLTRFEHAVSKPLEIFQAHWRERDDQARLTGHKQWQEGTITAQVLEDFKNLCGMLSSVPLPQHLR